MSSSKEEVASQKDTNAQGYGQPDCGKALFSIMRKLIHSFCVPVRLNRRRQLAALHG